MESVSSDISKLGQLWGIGVGPGDPELLTLKAVKCLRSAPVVAFPAGREGRPGIAQQIIQSFLAPSQIQLPLHFPYVQESDVLAPAWKTAAHQVWAYLSAGQDVVFATEGDASFYSTFTYLAQTLQQVHPAVTVNTVPGVCSPLAAAAVLGAPLTIQSQRLTVLPALYTLADLETTLDHAEVVVLMKVASVYAEVWRILQRRQLLHRSWVVVQATQPDQRVYSDLQAHPVLSLPYFSLLIIHCG